MALLCVFQNLLICAACDSIIEVKGGIVRFQDSDTSAGYASQEAPRAPKVRGENYPGEWPTFSHLVPQVGGDNVFKIKNSFHEVPNQETLVSKLKNVDRDEVVRAGGLRVESAPGEFTFLDVYLTSKGLATMDNRFPVLAIGSNASPAQIRNKFEHQDVSPIIPTLKCSIKGLNVGFESRQVSYGAYAAAPFIDDKKTSHLFVQFLDPDQLSMLDGTEDGYTRQRLVQTCEITLTDSGEILTGCDVYVSDSLCLATNGQRIELFPNEKTMLSQAELQSHLANNLKDGAMPSGFNIAPVPAEPQSYGRLIEVEEQKEEKEHEEQEKHKDDNEKKEGPVFGRAIGSRNALKRLGESVVVLHQEDRTASKINLGDLVAVWSALYEADASASGKRWPVALARVVPDSTGETPFYGKGVIQVDELIRVATGLRTGERVAVRKLKSPSKLKKLGTLLVDAIVGKPPYVMMRIEKAEISTAERDFALVPELAQNMMGIESGDPIIIESVDLIDAKLIKRKIVGLTLEEGARADRKNLKRGSWNSLHPSATEVLGVIEDLPPLMLDASNREMLGLKHQTLGAVRVRASRGRQYLKAFKELPVVLLALAISAGVFVDSNSGGLTDLSVWEPKMLLFCAFAIAVMLIGFIPTRVRLRSGYRSR